MMSPLHHGLMEFVWRAAQKANSIHSHQKKHGQQVKGSDSPPLLCSRGTPSGVLHPALEPSAQERHRPVGAGPEKGHKNDQRDGITLL